MVIIILGTGINEKGEISKETIKRLKEGYNFYKKNNGIIFLSGKYSFFYDKNNPPKITEAEAMANYLIKIGLKSEDIFLDKESEDTVFGAYRAKTELIIPKKEKKAVIITSDIHLERVEYIFNKVFGESCDLHFLALPSSFPCGGKGMIVAKQNIITEKVKNLLKEIKEGDHEAIKNKMMQFDYQKESSAWQKNFNDYKKTC